jgi:hypothetical protein
MARPLHPVALNFGRWARTPVLARIAAEWWQEDLGT